MKNVVIIPARLNSKRFPGKIIYKINGLPMVEHVRRRALLSKSIDNVFIATGDQDIANVLEKYNANIIIEAVRLLLESAFNRMNLMNLRSVHAGSNSVTPLIDKMFGFKPI